jgi:2-dehydropantoate 2-reductase
MRICVVGAGAIGGLLAVRLSAIGEEVTVIARGAHLSAIRARGLALHEADGTASVARVAATERIGEVGPQDLVVLAVKAHQLAPIAPEVKALLGPATVIVTAQNGIPWWYFLKQEGPWRGRRLESVDPGGAISAHLDVDRVVGSILYPAAELAAPGVIRHVEGTRVSLGEVDGSEGERVRALAELFRRAGFKARVASDLRAELWVKLWGNCTFNPLSALTHATLGEICGFAPTRALAAAMMREAQEVAERLGIRFPVSLEKRIAGAEAVGAHRTSMLQDVESGRPLELDALLGAVLELGELTGTATPNLRAVHACAALLAATLARSGGKLAITTAGLTPASASPGPGSSR